MCQDDDILWHPLIIGQGTVVYYFLMRKFWDMQWDKLKDVIRYVYKQGKQMNIKIKYAYGSNFFIFNVLNKLLSMCHVGIVNSNSLSTFKT